MTRFTDLVGQTLKEIIINDDKDEILFISNKGERYKMYHYRDCCESVNIDDINGDIKDLIGEPILQASEDSNKDYPKDPDWHESHTWTFYNLQTIKGHVQIKWYGESNGYYSESVDFDKIQ